MSHFKVHKTATAASIFAAVLLAIFVGCGGSTGNGDEKDEVRGGGALSNGGEGARITIDVQEELTVGGTAAFHVSLTGPDGSPLAFVQIFCESEKGIAIIEPSSGGVAFEHTNASGVMSGVLGGLSPGSYMLECRAPQGFNLKARQTLRITGTVPDGFLGFPGAAGGNLGGGLLDEDNPSPENGVTVSSLTFTEADEDEAVQIDIVRNLDCDADSTNEGGVDTEPFFFNNYNLTIANATEQTVFIETLTFNINDSGANSSTGTQAVTGSIAAGGTLDLTGPFTQFSGSSTKVFAGTGDAIEAGTFDVEVEITGATESGESFTITGSRAITFGSVNNCPASSASTTTTSTTTTTT